MPTIMSHAIIPLTVALTMNNVSRTSSPRITKSMIFTGMALAMLPDADVVGFAFGIDYGGVLGHRGASHALLVAAIMAGLITAFMQPTYWKTIFCFLFLSMASHGILDSFTNGGLGAALYWPFDETRYFAPFTPIEVSPIGRNFFSERGLITLWSELKWIWLPAFIIYALAYLLGNKRRIK